MIDLVENQVFQVMGAQGPSLIRVLWQARRLGQVSYIELPGRFPLWMPSAAFESQLAKGLILAVDDHPFIAPSLGDGRVLRPNKAAEVHMVKDEAGRLVPRISGAMRTAVKRYDAIGPLVNDENRGMLFRECRGKLLSARAVELGCARPYLYDACALYWTYGGGLAALGGRYGACGNPGQPKNWTKVPGPEAATGILATPLDDHMRAAFAYGVDYMRAHRDATYDDAFGQLLIKFYPKEAGRPEPKLQQFAYFARTNYPMSQRVRARKGFRTFMKDHAPHYGTTYGRAFGPGSCYEIDGTWDDHELLCEINRTIKVGRATIYIVVDLFSKAIVGFYVSLRQFNKRGVCNALRSAFTPKHELVERMGLPPDVAVAWPYGLPHNLISDRGKDQLADAVEMVSAYHRIGLETITAGRGDQKGTVENKNSEVKRLLRELAGRIKERLSDIKGTAPMLTVRHLNRIVAEVCHTLNTTRRVENCPPEARAADGTAPNRLELWRWGLVNRSGPKHDDADSIRFSMSMKVHVRETNKGFVWGNFVYKPDFELPGADCVKYTGKHWSKRILALDDRDVTRGWIVDRFGKPYCPVTLCGDAAEFYAGLSLDECRAYNIQVRQAQQKSRNDDARARAEGRNRIQVLNDEAVQETKAFLETGMRPGEGGPPWLESKHGTGQDSFSNRPVHSVEAVRTAPETEMDIEDRIAAAQARRAEIEERAKR